MNSKSGSIAAWWAEPQPVETGLSVDDRPNELNIAFWVISSVGAASPLLLHIIYVSVRAPSLSISLSFISRPPTQTHHYLFLSQYVLHTLFLSLHFIPLQHLFFLPFISPPKLQFCPLVSLTLFFALIFISKFFSLSLSFTLYLSPAFITLSLSSFILFISASLCIPPSLPPSAAPCFFLSDTLWAFFLSSYLSLWASLSLPSLSFSLPLSLSLISEPCVWSSIALC